ncbi:MAG: sulfite exporter TauE/SafE family protein [Mahellales bacterium]|jgi:uncharacterized membrane protein YfcA
MLLVLIGLLSGIIGGMGIGGGTILIPALILLIGLKQQMAQSVNLLSFIPTAIIALVIHWKNKNIKWKLALNIILLGIVGAIIGSYLAVYLSPGLLKRLFGIFLLIMGVYEFFRKGTTANNRK